MQPPTPVEPLYNGSLIEAADSPRQDLLVVNEGTRLFQWVRQGDGAWADGVPFAEDAATWPAVARGAEGLHAVYLGVTGLLRAFHQDAQGVWRDGGVFGPLYATGVPGLCLGPPGADGARPLHAVVSTGDGRLCHWRRDAAAGAAWAEVARFGSGVFTSGPALALDGAGRPELVCARGDGKLGHYTQDEAGQWIEGATFGERVLTPPVLLSHVGGQGANADAAQAPGRLEVFVAVDGAVQHWAQEPAGGWRQLGAFGEEVAAVLGAVRGRRGLELILARRDGQVLPYTCDLVLWRHHGYGPWGRGLGICLTSCVTPAGGSPAVAPTVVATGAGRLALFAPGPDSALRVLTLDETGWGAWEALDLLQGSPAAVAPGANGKLDVFFTNLGQGLNHGGAWDGSRWQTGKALTGVLTSAPVAVLTGESRMDVFGVGTDRALWHLRHDGAWGQWESLGGSFGFAPALVSPRPGTLELFVTGRDRSLWHTRYDSLFGAWETLGGPFVGTPAVVVSGRGRLDVFALGTDQALWHRVREGARWGEWQSLGGVFTSRPAAVASAPGRIDVFAVGTERALWHRALLVDTGRFGDWTWLDGYFTSPPAVVSLSSGRMDIFAIGLGQIPWHQRYDGRFCGWERAGNIHGTALDGWRRCQRCATLFRADQGDGVCPAGGKHASGDSPNYYVQLSAPPSPPPAPPTTPGGEAPGKPREAAPPRFTAHFRRCHRCQGLYHAPLGERALGRCPAGGVHTAWASGDFTLQHAAAGVRGQGWHRCGKCHSLFHGNGAGQGVCAMGGPHDGRAGVLFELPTL